MTLLEYPVVRKILIGVCSITFGFMFLAACVFYLQVARVVTSDPSTNDPNISPPRYEQIRGTLAPVALDKASPTLLVFQQQIEPAWVSPVLEVLDQLQVKAVFIVSGAAAFAYSDLITHISSKGHVVGTHGFTPGKVQHWPQWRLRIEKAVSGAILRALVTNNSYRDTSSIFDFDSTSGRRPITSGSEGNLRMIAALLHANLVTVADPKIALSTHLTKTASTISATPQTQMFWITLVGTNRAIQALTVLMTVLLVLGLLRSVFIVVCALLDARKTRRSAHVPLNKPVSILIPAHNEEMGIARTVAAVLMSTHEDFEIIIVNDGSTDNTLGELEQFDDPRVTVISQTKQGKAAALTTGLRAASHSIIVSIDADTIIEPGALGPLVAPFSDPTVGAVGGNIKVGNRTNILAIWQHIEYVTGIGLDRRAYNFLCCAPTVPGALGAFRKEAIDQAGGFLADTLAEDTDLTIAIHQANWNVRFVFNARAWTEVPANVRTFWKQRFRWIHGIMQSFWKHRRSLTTSGHGGQMARRAYPLILVLWLLNGLLTPLIDLYIIGSLIVGEVSRTVLLWALIQLATLALVAVGFLLERESLKTLWALPLQFFGYRQILSAITISSLFVSIAGHAAGWRPLERSGTARIIDQPARPA